MPDLTEKELKQAQKKGLKLGGQIQRSNRKFKKLMVTQKDGKKIHFGDTRYGSFLQGASDERRRLYKIRHEKDRKKPNTAGFWADKILW